MKESFLAMCMEVICSSFVLPVGIQHNLFFPFKLNHSNLLELERVCPHGGRRALQCAQPSAAGASPSPGQPQMRHNAQMLPPQAGVVYPR